MATLHVFLYGVEVYPYPNKNLGAKTIQKAINAAKPGDTILVHGADNKGCRLTYKENITIKKSLMLKGKKNEWPIIDGGRNDPTRKGDKVIKVLLISGFVFISGFEIKNGLAKKGDGAGIYLRTLGKVLIINNCIHGNEADKHGGGIYVLNNHSGVIIINNNIHHNTANQGGGIYVDGLQYIPGGHNPSSNCIIIANRIGARNVANRGGGICVFNGSVLITENEILENIVKPMNKVKPSGAGVNIRNSDSIPATSAFLYLPSPIRLDVKLQKNYIHHNKSSEDGGGVSVEFAGEAIFEDNRLESNRCTDDGGGIYATVASKVKMASGNTLYKNIAKCSGGGIHATCKSSVFICGKNVIKENQALDSDNDGGGGGIYIRHSLLETSGTLHLIGNTTQGYGGGILSITHDFPLLSSPIKTLYEFCEMDTGIAVTGALIEKNKANKEGAGIAVLKNEIMVPRNDTIIKKSIIKNNASTNSSIDTIGIYMMVNVSTMLYNFKPEVRDCRVEGHHQTLTATGLYMKGKHNLIPIVKGSVFENNSIGYKLEKVHEAEVYNNKFSHQKKIQLEANNAKFDSFALNDFESRRTGNNRTSRGIVLYWPIKGIFKYNNIYGHMDFGMEEIGTPASTSINASSNWWGNVNGPTPPGTSFNPSTTPPQGDRIRTRIKWKPPLSSIRASFPGAPKKIPAPPMTKKKSVPFSMLSEYPGGIKCE